MEELVKKFCNERPEAYDIIIDVVETFNNDTEAQLVILTETIRHMYPRIFYPNEVESELDYDIDNRDDNTTWLWVKDAAGNKVGYVEVQISELVENAKENNPDE